MPSNPQDPKERRSSPRIDAKIEVQFQSGKDFARCYTENLSKGGILLQTDELPDPNATIEVVLYTPGNDTHKISVRGKVVRRITVSENSKKVHKVALQFVDITADAQTEIDRLYELFSK